jgi:glycosyltransferase involved in cell wall biosynthesis
MARFDLTLGVVSQVRHWPREGGQPFAYEPYVREMEVWASLFGRVIVCAPLAEEPMVGNQVPYLAPNLHWVPLRYTVTTDAGDGRRRARQLPGLCRTLVRLAHASDFVLLRSPAQVSLFGRVIAGAVGVPTITKWAGLFAPYDGELPLVRLERLHVERRPEPALVYGPAARPHLIPFIPALMTRNELAQARLSGEDRRWEPPWRLLCVGRLSGEKGFDLVIRGLARLRESHADIPWALTVVGDGPEAPALRSLAAREGVADRTTFVGAVSFDRVGEHYARAHALIMPGVMEGWPKTIAEAWAHGAVPVAAAAGIVPWIIERNGSGVTFDPTPEGLAGSLALLLSEPGRMRAMSSRGYQRCDELSLETFAARLEGVLVADCGLS